MRLFKETFEKFEHVGVKLLDAYNGKESIDSIMEEKPELVILNAIIREMN